MKTEHQEESNTFTLLMYALLMILMFWGGTAFGQATLTDANFTKVNNGTSVVEFWAPWNEQNMCSEWLLDITGATYYIMDVQSKQAKDLKIKVLPTLIVFNDGIEIKRFEGNIQFQLCPKRTPKKVQGVINELSNLNRY